MTAAVRAAVIAYGAAVSVPTLALGLGEIEMQSFLNEPLRAQVELLDTRQLTVDDIRIRLAGVDDFDRLGVERSYFLTSIQFDIEVDEATGRGVIKLSTDDAVLEPFVDLIVEARWPSGRLLREYTVLVDPPTFEQDVVTVSALERVQQNTDLEKPALAPESQAQQSRGASQQSRSTDNLALRKSSLPAGQMPSRAFSAETVDVPRSGNRYMVKRDETLWQIALQGKPGDISVQQAMLEIQRLNPEAFINGNINRIKAGYIIYLPASGEISSDDLARALDEVREQNQEWREGRGAPGVTAAATLRVSADSTAGMQRQRDDADSAMETQASTAGRPSTANASQPDITTSSEQAMATMDDGSAASSELAAQLSDMASRLDTLEQIVSLKDQQIATLEQALREAREAAANAVAAPPVAAQTAAPKPTPAATPAAASPAPAASGGIPWLPISGGLLAIVAGVVLLLRRRASNNDAPATAYAAAVKPAQDDVFAGVNLKEETFDADEPEVSAKVPAEVPADDSEANLGEDVEEAPVTEADSRGGSRGYGERKHDDYIDEGAAGDALAEADIYIAYGRYLQAIELLDTAIAGDPANSAYRLKLIELYVDMGEEASASEQLDALREHGDESAIARGEALVGGAGVAAAVPELDLDAVDDEPEELSLGDSLELESDTGLSLPDEPETLELGDTLELSLDDDAGALDNDQPVAVSDAALDDLDDDLESVEFEHLEIEEDAVMDADNELDFATAEEELDLSDALVFAEDESSDDLIPESADPETEDLLIADDADQMATKLDLARAYLDMGDSEGARGILEEVVAKGTEEQQQESRDLLTRIG